MSSFLDEALKNIGQVKGNLPDTDIYSVIGNIINIFLGLLGIILLGLFLYAGFQWATAGGNTKKIDTAKAVLKNAFIGLIIILLSAVLANFALRLLAAITSPPR